MQNQSVDIDRSWYQVLENEFQKPYFQHIKTFLKNAKAAKKIVYPPGPLIFNAFNSTPFDQVKVVILGQDPYHRPNQAMGLSFSVPKGVRTPPSLINIYKEIQRDLNHPIPPHGDLTSWATQGVFLLNAMLTVEDGQPGAHKDLGWQIFTDSVIQILSQQREHLVFLLWGNFAKQKKVLIDSNKHLILESAHPSPLAGNAFQNCAHFSKTNEYLKQHNILTIDWRIDA